MGAQSELMIQEMNEALETAYNQIEDAIRNLYALDVAESAILLSVRIIYRNIKDGEESLCKVT